MNSILNGKTLVISGDGLLGDQLKIHCINDERYFFTSRKVDSKEDNYLDLNRLLDFNFTGAEKIIYCAQSRNSKSSHGAADINLINTSVPVKIAKMCGERGIHFTYLSSGSVYQPAKQPLRESDQLMAANGASEYVKSKLEAENLILRMENCLVLRPFFLVGTKADLNTLIPTLIRRIKNREKVYLEGEKGMLISITPAAFAADVARTLVNQQSVGVFNLSSNLIFSIRELSLIIGSFLGVNVEFQIREEMLNLVADLSALRNQIQIEDMQPDIVLDIIKNLCEIELSESRF